MNYIFQVFGVSLIAFSLVWYFVSKRHLVGIRHCMSIVLIGAVVTTGLCGALRYASLITLGDFVFYNPPLAMQIVFFVGAPFGFALVVARLVRPLKSPGGETQSPHVATSPRNSPDAGHDLKIL